VAEEKESASARYLAISGLVMFYIHSFTIFVGVRINIQSCREKVALRIKAHVIQLLLWLITIVVEMTRCLYL